MRTLEPCSRRDCAYFGQWHFDEATGWMHFPAPDLKKFESPEGKPDRQQGLAFARDVATVCGMCRHRRQMDFYVEAKQP